LLQTLVLLSALAGQPAAEPAQAPTPEQLAVGTIRSIISAQAYHRQTYPQQGYACDIERLVEVEALLDTLSHGRAVDGYVFRVWCEKASRPQATYHASAVPVKRAPGSQLTVCTDQTNVPRTIEGDARACFDKGVPPLK
jgi:hypothetical protein